MAYSPISADGIRKTEEYLKGYMLNKKLVELEIYEKEYFGDHESEWEKDLPGDLSLAKARMFEVRHFVLGFENCEEKLLLYYRYIHMGGKDVDTLGIFLYTADIHHRAGEDNIHIILFRCFVSGLGKLQNFVAVQVGLGADFKERGFNVGHSVAPLSKFLYIIPIANQTVNRHS